MEQSSTSETKKESDSYSINPCQSQIEGAEGFKEDKINKITNINTKEVEITSELTQVNSYNDKTSLKRFSSGECETGIHENPEVVTSVVGGFKHKYCVGGNNHVCGNNSSDQNLGDGKYFPVCSNSIPVDCDCPLGFHNNICNQKRNKGHSSFYGIHNDKKRMKGLNMFRNEAIDNEIHHEHIARNCVTCSAVSFFIPEVAEDGSSNTRPSSCLHVLSPSCKCCETSAIQTTNASASILQDSELSSHNSQLYGKVTPGLNRNDSNKKGAKKKIRVSQETVEPTHDAGCGHWCNSCQAKMTDVKPERRNKEMKAATSKTPPEPFNVATSMTLPAKPKHSLKAKLTGKFLHNKNKQDGENSKHKRKNSLTNWFNCISLTNKIGSNSNLTSSSKSTNILSPNRSNSQEATLDIELEHPQIDEDESKSLPRPITSDKETVAYDNESSSTSSDEDFLNQPIVGSSNISAPSVTSSVPLPFAYNSVLELHLLLERSLRLSILGNGSLQSDRFSVHNHPTGELRENTDSSLSQGIHTQVDYIHCLVPDLLQVTNCSFYWGKMDRYEAEALLDNRPEGTFLLRDSAQDEYLFSVSFRRYGKSLHARIEQLNHKFSFDSLDPGVFASGTVCGLIEHYKDPSCCMFFEPMLTNPLPRSFPFPLQHLCRATICSSSTYNGISQLELPRVLKNYLKEYHYKQKVRVRRLDY